MRELVERMSFAHLILNLFYPLPVHVAQRAWLLYFFVMFKCACCNYRSLEWLIKLTGYLLDFFLVVKACKVVNVFAWLIVAIDLRPKVRVRKHDSFTIIKLKHIWKFFFIILFGAVIRKLLLAAKTIECLWTLVWIFQSWKFFVRVVLGAKHFRMIMVCLS